MIGQAIAAHRISESASALLAAEQNGDSRRAARLVSILRSSSASPMCSGHDARGMFQEDVAWWQIVYQLYQRSLTAQLRASMPREKPS